MNDKILITLKIPMIEQEFDILVPEYKKIGNIKTEIIKVVNESFPNLLDINNNFSMYEKTNGTVLRNDMYAKNYIKNGSHLILI